MWVSLPMKASHSCSMLTGVQLNVGSCCCISSTLRFNVLCVLGCFLLTMVVKSELFEWLMLAPVVLLWPLINKVFYLVTLCLWDVFGSFAPFCVNSRGSAPSSPMIMPWLSHRDHIFHYSGVWCEHEPKLLNCFDTWCMISCIKLLSHVWLSRKRDQKIYFPTKEQALS